MTGAELQDLIDAAGRGYVDGRGGRLIQLPPGPIELTETIISGGDHPTTAQVGMRFEGEARTQTQFRGDNGRSGGTTLVWKGQPGGTMWRHLGGAFVRFADLTLQMDPGNPEAEDPEKAPFDGTLSAGVGIELSGKNATAAVTQSPSMDRVFVDGSRDVRTKHTIGYLITGAKNDDQVDGCLLSDIQASKVGFGLVVNNQQSIENEVIRGKFGANVAAVYVKEGSLCLSGSCETNAWEKDAAHVWVGRLANYIRSTGHYAEVKECEAVYKIGGDTQGAQSFRSNLVIKDGRFNHQGDASRGESRIPFVKGTWQGLVTLRDNDFTAAGGAGDDNSRQRFFMLEGQTAGSCKGRLRLWDNNCWDRFGGFKVGEFDPSMELSVDGDRQHIDMWR